MNSDEILVSVFCLVYNHEKYLKKMLDSLVKQKTNFRYEIVIHDDASTDNSANIIKEYEKKYSNLIVPIYENENKYSKGISIENIVFPITKGKYIAICEGDDYWCDNNKLQIQVEYMESHPECSLCVHNSKLISESGKELNQLNNKVAKYDKEYNTNDIIGAGGGVLFHTSSFLYRKEYILKKPYDFEIKYSGDYTQAIWLSLCGKVFYINRVMSAHRILSIGSWSYRNKKDNKLRILSRQRHVDGLKIIDKYTNYRFHKSIIKRVRINEFRLYLYQKNYYKIILKPSLWISGLTWLISFLKSKISILK